MSRFTRGNLSNWLSGVSDEKINSMEKGEEEISQIGEIDSQMVKRNCKDIDEKEAKDCISSPCNSRGSWDSDYDRFDEITPSLEPTLNRFVNTLIKRKTWIEEENNMLQVLEGEMKELQDVKDELQHLKNELQYLKNELQYNKNELQDAKNKLEDDKNELEDAKNELQFVKNELNLTLEELGRYLFENDEKDMKKRREDLFEKTFKTNVVNITSSTSTLTHELSQAEKASTSAATMQTIEAEDQEASTSTASMQTIGEEANVAIMVVQEIPQDDEVKGSVQESREASSNRGRISLATVPSTAIERSIYNNYKLLLLTISDMLLSNDERGLKIWASETFSLNPSSDVNEVFSTLDRKDVISSSNLTQLRAFFAEKLLRFDVVHLIDCYLCGDYTRLLRSIMSGKNNKASSNIRNRAPAVTPVANPKQPPMCALYGGDPNNGNCEIENYPRTNPSNAGLVATDGAARYVLDDTRHAKVGSVASTSDGDQQRPKQPSEQREPQVDVGSNGNKLSEPQHQDSSKNPNPSPPDSNDDDVIDEDGNWLCNHYKRRCHVKFACCDKYWPCHRCHNNESNCGQTKLKSIHTKFVRCVKCSTEQEFNERSQFCVNCHTKFAKYFCPTCKHLTGNDDKPYHCQQCGICRIHEHRSFHCETCGVCLDVQLRDNHKCREGSAHDECCICLEDAFTGCQILPCSHKVHKECATQMIRRGITRCPICRESFAHKLEKRQVVKPPARKHHGRK